MIDFNKFEVLDIDTEGKTDDELLDMRPEVRYECQFHLIFKYIDTDYPGFFKRKDGEFQDTKDKFGYDDMGETYEYDSLLEIKSVIPDAIKYDSYVNNLVITKYISVGGVFMSSEIRIDLKEFLK